MKKKNEKKEKTQIKKKRKQNKEGKRKNEYLKSSKIMLHLVKSSEHVALVSKDNI